MSEIFLTKPIAELSTLEALNVLNVFVNNADKSESSQIEYIESKYKDLGIKKETVKVTKTEIDEALDNVSVDLSDYYTKTEIDGKVTTLNNSINGKATKATTLSGYGITNVSSLSSTLSANKSN